MAVLAPMPRARTATAPSVKPGLLASSLRPCLRSWVSVPMNSCSSGLHRANRLPSASASPLLSAKKLRGPASTVPVRIRNALFGSGHTRANPARGLVCNWRHDESVRRRGSRAPEDHVRVALHLSGRNEALRVVRADASRHEADAASLRRRDHGGGGRPADRAGALHAAGRLPPVG